MKFATVVFPGSNCDHDCEYAALEVGQSHVFLWHKEHTIPPDVDCILLPGGFSYGDYLRCGAIAHLSPIMEAVKSFAEKGGLVLGICNGFQILVESGLLPGALMVNRGLHFICKPQYLRIEKNSLPFTKGFSNNEVVNFPIAHKEGNYFIEAAELEKLEQNGQIVLRYCDADGNISNEANPNGSANNIAGICNKNGNVLGMMPHPERAISSILGCEDGRKLFRSIVEHFQ